MKTLLGAIAGLGVAFSVSLAFANPSLLPKHPGYPGGQAVSPVTGQPLANDSGQTNMGGEKAMLESAERNSRHTMQELKPETGRDAIINEQGAGRVPKHPGYYDYKIEPPVNSATKIGPDRVIQ
ncbi:MAG TPA: hypothetical protein VJ692_02200 [Nitrospiraceae bacterium]|nr:hypothetical protein [Nitrospiraceae bacterium]